MKLIKGKGNLLDSTCDALVNPVNCVGVMGKGLALAFKEMHPTMYENYKVDCRNRLLNPGEVHYYKADFSWDQPQQWVICFTTKNHWSHPSHLKWIESGLDHLASTIVNYPIQSIAMPPIGCGNGGLNWAVVRSMILEKLNPLDMYLHLWEK